jgi:hypothetical protein
MIEKENKNVFAISAGLFSKNYLNIRSIFLKVLLPHRISDITARILVVDLNKTSPVKR